MTHPVLGALGGRAATGSRPGARSDGHRIALVIEGGGMRGVVSAAMAAAVEDLGLLDAFDLVVGSSAGALNGAALLAGVAGGCADEYAEGFAGRRFINPARLLLGRPAVDVDYVLAFSSERLDADRHARTLASPLELHCVATDVAEAAARDLTALEGHDELRGALLASSRLPWIGGDPVELRGRRWLDGGLSQPIPLDTALSAGATHALVLLTRPRGAGVESPGGLADRLVERRLRALNSALVELYRSRPAAYAAQTERVLAATDEPSGAPPHVMALALPAGTEVPSRLERDAEPLRRVAAAARRWATEALSAPG